MMVSARVQKDCYLHRQLWNCDDVSTSSLDPENTSEERPLPLLLPLLCYQSLQVSCSRYLTSLSTVLDGQCLMEWWLNVLTLARQNVYLMNASLQDVAAAMILSEAVYKALDGSLKQAVDALTPILAGLPEGLRQPLKVQWSLPNVSHRSARLPSPYTAFTLTFQSYSIIDNSLHIA